MKSILPIVFYAFSRSSPSVALTIPERGRPDPSSSCLDCHFSVPNWIPYIIIALFVILFGLIFFFLLLSEGDTREGETEAEEENDDFAFVLQPYEDEPLSGDGIVNSDMFIPPPPYSQVPGQNDQLHQQRAGHHHLDHRLYDYLHHTNCQPKFVQPDSDRPQHHEYQASAE
ncbi:hypothetical protein L218DRAFT_1001227 [Marasmius fiardii PR-910]|nr:hypothetical protein L218DRAFT_1001227 [Marasmius fiardii PR-910]